VADSEKIAIGIDVGGTKTRGVALSNTGEQLGDHTVPTPEGEQQLLDAIVEVSQQIGKTTGSQIAAIGIGIAGLVTNEGVFVKGPHLPKVNNVDIASELHNHFETDISIYVDNDANVAAWAEYKRGAGRGSKNLTLLTFGTGIGGGIILDGKLFRGARGFSGEFGHHVIEENGVNCECGRRGCWEQYASGNALGRFGREAAQDNSVLVQVAGGVKENIRGQHVVEAAKKGDDTATMVVKKYAGWVAEGLANISNMLDVQTFVMGGGIADAGDTLLQPIKESYDLIAYRPNSEIVIAELGSSANAIGAADLAWETH
jgi:glucokinase